MIIHINIFILVAIVLVSAALGCRVTAFRYRRLIHSHLDPIKGIVNETKTLVTELQENRAIKERRKARNG